MYVVLVTQSCLTLHDVMECSSPTSSIHGILQARILKWVAIPFSRGFSWPRDQTQVSGIAGRFFTLWATREAHLAFLVFYKNICFVGIGKAIQRIILEKREGP